jgi:predicted acylesterase/phospholipase RssA/MinD-like ATPase involved in chromosome partitioning or flagellar assembly
VIYTFYSYKGGVGRSMALANIAKWFYLHGLRVVMVDWDLEAPGIENFFFDPEEQSGKDEFKRIQDRPGLIDLLIRYQRRFPALPFPPWPKVFVNFLEQHLPPSLPDSLAHADPKQLLKALEQSLPSTLRPAFDTLETETALKALEKSLPATVSGSFGERKTEEVLATLRESIPPTLTIPFEQADASTLLKVLEETWLATPRSSPAQTNGANSRTAEPDFASLVAMLAGSLSPTVTVSFDEAYRGPLLRLLEESLPASLPLSADVTSGEEKHESLSSKAIMKLLAEHLPSDFVFTLRRAYSEALLGTLEETLPPFSAMLYPIYQGAHSDDGHPEHQDAPPTDERPPGLWLLSAGWRYGERFPAYARNVQSFDWTDFYNSFQGEAYFEWVRNQLNRFADVILIDSRTGVTEMGGVCTRQLADVVVSLVAPNGQNLDGVTTMVESFRREEVSQARRKWEEVSSTVDGSLEVVVIPARVETTEVDERNKFEKRFRQQLDKMPTAFQKVNSSFWDLKIPYIPYYAYNEKLVIGISIGGKGRSEELEKAYKDLGVHLAMLAPERSTVRKRFAKDLRESFPNALPGVTLVAYARGEREAAFELCAGLESEDVSVWEGLAAIEDVPGEEQQLGGVVDQCESLVIVVSPESATSDAVLRQWRYARQQGKCVYLIGRGISELRDLSGEGRAAGQGVRRLPKSAETFDIADWQRLARKLKSPCHVARVPFMAPIILTKFIGRASELERLKSILLKDDRNALRRSGVDAAICGMGGSGKSALARTFCYDEEVLNYFDGGVLWVSLGVHSDILGELTKLYVALTGERTTFNDVDVATRELSERLRGQNCLMVLDDIWDRNDLKLFVRAGEFCGILMTTRDRSLAAEGSAEVVLVGEMSTQEAVEIIKSQLRTSSDDFETQYQLAGLVERLGNSPLAIQLAGAELRMRVEQGERPASAVEYLKQALDVQGVVAFDTPGAQDRNLSVAKTVALSLDRLTEEERTRFAQLAEFENSHEIALEEISRKWGMDTFKTELLVQRLGYMSLLRFDPERKTVTLHELLRSYIIDQQLLAPHKKETAGPRSDDGEAVARARNILRGQSGDTPAEMYKLVKQLKREKQFGLARRILIKTRKDPRLNEDKKLLLTITQQLSLCTRKDPDLPADERLDLAFEILKETGEDLNKTQDQETLGLAGAICKNKWELDGQRQHLERSLAYYLRGQRVGVATDFGYTGINAAYVLDLLADQEESEAARAGTTSEGALARRRESTRIREEIVGSLPALAKQPGQEWLTKEWWFLVTIAEAFFGLRRYDEALYWLKEAAAVPKVADWEYETTARQFANIARLQDAGGTDSGELKESKAWDVLRVFLKNDWDAVRSTFVGKVGLALSGGGFRASLFHIGVLARLAELDSLRNVEVLSCVSGGSIIGAHYYLEVRKLLESKPDSEIKRQDYIEIVRRIERDFLAGVQRNIRTRVAASLFTNLKMIFLPNYSRTERVGELYESEIFSRVGADERANNGPRYLRIINPLYLDELMVRPADGPADFTPRADNWRRAAKVPVLILNATTLNTGHNWQFTTSWMGEPPSSIATEIDGNDRLRRLYYQQAPAPHGKVRLGHAVAASACVPGLFEPLALSNLYPEKIVRLVDGGVHDNQGIAGLLGEDCTTLLVSDASGQMSTLNNPRPGLFGVSVRSNSILMARVREAEYREIEARKRSSLLRGLMFIHLKKGLEVDPVDWLGCDDPYEATEESHTTGRRGIVTPYGMRKDVQQSLSAIRTDLDSFSDKEAYALMSSGYRMAGHEFAESIKGFPPTPDERTPWRFLAVEKSLDRARGFEDAHRDLMTTLNIGSARALKVWKLMPMLSVAFLLGCIVLVSGLFALYMTSSFLQNLLSRVRDFVVEVIAWSAGFVIGVIDVVSAIVIKPVGAVVTTTLAMALLIFGLRTIQLVRRHKPLTNIVLGVAMASVGWLAAGLHLLVFDKLFLRHGRVEAQERTTNSGDKSLH